MQMWLLVAAWASAGVAGTAGQTRVAVLLVPGDAFSGRAAARLEYLLGRRIAREPGHRLVSSEQVVLATGSHGSEKTLEPVQEILRRGLGAYENLELDAAIHRLSEAAGKLERNPAAWSRRHAEQYARALMFLGASYILTGEPQQGQETFRRLLVVDPDARLDPKLFPPGMVATFESVRREVTGGARGSLAVASVPGHGKVFVDGEFRGVTPATVEKLPVGKHLVVVRKTGFESWGGPVQIGTGHENRAQCRLLDLVGGDVLLARAKRAAAVMDERDVLAPGLRELLDRAGVDVVLLGRTLRHGQGVGYLLAAFEVSSGQRLRSHGGVLDTDSDAFERAVGELAAYLITGRGDVLQSTQDAVADWTPSLRLEDELRFDQEETPVYERWYFWTAIGAGVGCAALVLALVLPGEDRPASQLVIEFSGQP